MCEVCQATDDLLTAVNGAPTPGQGGFQFDLPASLLPKPGSRHKVRVFAVRGGAAGELRYLRTWPWGH